MPTKTVWLTYDLSFNGDYDALYAFLDQHEAKECGDSVAYFDYVYKENFVEELKAELGSAVSLQKQDRIYVIFKSDGKLKGKWLFGRRKKAPWSGYAFVEEVVAEDEA